MTTRQRVRSVVGGSLATVIVTALGFFDDWTVGPIVIALAAVLPALATFAITAVVYGFVQYGASLWLVRGWDEWMKSDDGRRFAARLQKRRQGRITSRAVQWITHGSIWWFVVGSVILATVDVVAILQLTSAESVPRPRIMVSAAVYGTWCAALWTAAGYGIGKGISLA